MKQVRLIYASRLKSGVETTEVAKIHATALARNAIKQLTGMLVFGEDCFLQCLEGSLIAVNELYVKICKDPRHKDIMLLSFAEIEKQEFDTWAMKLVLMTEKNKDLVLKHTSLDKFQPSEMNGISSLNFLMAIR